jgi:hypothetical protein
MVPVLTFPSPFFAGADTAPADFFLSCGSGR